MPKPPTPMLRARAHVIGSGPAICTAFGVGSLAVGAVLIMTATNFFPTDLQKSNVTALDWLFGVICLAALVAGNSVVRRYLTRRLSVNRALVAGVAATGLFLIAQLSVGSTVVSLVRAALGGLVMVESHRTASLAVFMGPSIVVAFAAGVASTILFCASASAPQSALD
jgi:hypothetical protein